MKKLFKFCCVLVCVALLLPVFGCMGSADGGVHIFYYAYSDTYLSTVRAALDKTLTAAGVNFQNYDGNSSQATQTEQVQTAITKGAKLLVVNVVTTGSDEAAAGLVEMAKTAGIPIIFFNREVSDAVIQSYDKAAYVGTTATEAGELQGEMIGEYLVKNFEKVDLNGDGVLSYVLFMGEKGNNEAIYRTRFAVEGADAALTAAGHPALKFYDPANTDRYLVDRDGKWSAQAANEYMTTIFSAYSDANNNMVEVVICNNDSMAEGAVSALTTVGYNRGDGGKAIPVFGVDATDAAKSLIQKGAMVGTIRQDGEGMANAIARLIQNGLEDRDLLDGTTDLTVDAGVDKIRIPYSKYLGE